MTHEASNIPLRVDSSSRPLAKCLVRFPTPCIAQHEVRSTRMDFIEYSAQSLEVAYSKRVRAILTKNPAVLDGVRRIKVDKVFGPYTRQQYFLKVSMA
jgi:hypothetical protein